MPVLRRINHDKATELEIDRQDMTFGRNQDCDVCVEKYEDISRNHCGFHKYEDGVVTVTDFSSRNGTYVNDKQIFEETKLTHGDKIRICNQLQFEFVDYDSPEGKAELKRQEEERKAAEEREKRKIVVEGDSEMSEAMSDLNEELSEGRNFKSIMAEIVKDTKKDSSKYKPKSLKDDEETDSVNQYEEFKVKRRRL